MKTAVAILFISLFFLHNAVFAQVDPAINWKVMHLPHFDLIYDASQQDLADFYAPRLESHIQTLKPYFSYFPEKIAIVLNDNSDLTNGFATPFPYDQIQIFPVLPGAQESIGEYGDWAHEVTLHEYTHALSFQPRRGVVKALHWVLGSIITPNMLLPRWFLEGVAVDFETRFTEHGRLRSAQQDASLRALHLENKLAGFSLAEINETSLHTYPQGARPYLFGSLIWSEIIQDNSTESVKNLHDRYGGRVPYFLNGPAKDLTGQSYEDLLAKALSSTQTRIEAQVQKLKAQPPTRMQNLNWIVAETFNPEISPDGRKMAYISRGETLKRGVKIIERSDFNESFRAENTKDVFQNTDGEGGVESAPLPRKDGPPGGTINRISWFPDSHRFLYDRLDARNRYHERSDLYVYDIRTRKSEQISFGLRAREAAVNPDGKSAVFVHLFAGKTALSWIDFESKAVRVLKYFEAQERASWPSFLDARNVIFSLRQNGNDCLHILNLESQTLRQVLPDYKESLFPEVGAQGLFFSSTKNGVRNIYLASSDFKTATPVTHSLTGVATASYDDKRDDLYVSETTGEGLKIRFLPMKDRFKGSALPEVASLFADRYEKNTKSNFASVTGEIDSYNSFSYLFPKYWIPWYSSDARGWDFSVAISAADPLAKQTYNLSATYDNRTNEKNYSFTYLNTTGRTWFLTSALDLYSYVGTTSNRYRSENYLAAGIWELPNISTDLTVASGWMWRTRDFQTAKFFQSGPFLNLKYLGYSQSGSQISPEGGWAADLSYSHWRLQNDYPASNLYQASVQNYFSKWLPKRNVLFWRLKYMLQDERISAADLEQTYGTSLSANTPFPIYVMRGYENAQFLAKSLNQATLEYRFPISYRYFGFGTNPLAFKRFHAALIADGIQVDGFSLKEKAYEAVDKSSSHWTGGLELKTDLTFGYHFPFTLVLGFYSTLSSPRYPAQNNLLISFQGN
jgi:Tol biopolymer transport system component